MLDEKKLNLLKEICEEYDYDLLVTEKSVICKLRGSNHIDDIYKYNSIKDALISWKETLVESDKCNDAPVWGKEISFINYLEEELPIAYGKFTNELNDFYTRIYINQNIEVDKLMDSFMLDSGKKVKVQIPVEIEYDKDTNDIKRVSIAKISFLKRLIFDKDTSEIEKEEMDVYDKNGLIENIKLRPVNEIGERVMFFVPALSFFVNRELTLVSVDHNIFFR